MEAGQSNIQDDKGDERDILKRMLIGPPINAPRPCVEEINELLTRYLNGIPEVLKQTYGENTEATREAIKDCTSIANMECSAEGVICKRAALLFALRREPELREYFRKLDSAGSPGSPGFTVDLTDRVLPFVDPEFMRHSCQVPEAYVFTTVILSQLFEGERLGNWPLTTTEPLGC